MDAAAPAASTNSVAMYDGDDATFTLEGLRLARVNDDLAANLGRGSERGFLVLESNNRWRGLRAGDVLLEIDVQGALQVRHHYPDALLIFILPPDEPTLLQRLQDRGRDSAEDIHKRFMAAKREIHMAKGARAFDTMVVNDDLNEAVEDIAKIIRHKRAGGI